MPKLNIYSKLNKVVINQKEAVETISRAIIKYYKGNKSKEKPIAVLLFVGPTGVGKTHLTKCLAQYCFGSENCMIRFDMSEFNQPHNAADFVGAPPGYVGFDRGSNFINSAIETREGIFLLDEIEKAHPDVLNVLLQVFDDGKLTDKRNGRVINFKNFIFIMTSNIGQQESIDESDIDVKKEIIFSCLKKALKPKFRNRIDEVVYFEPLSSEGCRKVTINELNKSIKEKLDENEIEIILNSSVIDYIVERGFNPFLNARPLKRAIDKYFEDPFSELELRGEVKKEDKFKVFISKDENKITFRELSQ